MQCSSIGPVESCHARGWYALSYGGTGLVEVMRPQRRYCGSRPEHHDGATIYHNENVRSFSEGAYLLHAHPVEGDDGDQYVVADAEHRRHQRAERNKGFH